MKCRVLKELLLVVAIAGSCFAFYGCGGSGSSNNSAGAGDQNVDATTQPVEFKTAAVVSVDLQVPVNRESITATDLEVESVLNSAGDEKAVISDVGGPTVLMANDSEGKALLLGYAMPASAQAAAQKKVGRAKMAAVTAITDPASVEISPRSTALALTMVNSVFLGTRGEERSAIAAEVVEMPEFDNLQGQVFETFEADPHFLDHLDMYPDILSLSSNIAKQALDGYIASQQASAAEVAAKNALLRSALLAAPVVGREVDSLWTSSWNARDPWIWYDDDAGDVWEMPFVARPTTDDRVIGAGNPALIPYAAEYYKKDGTRLSDWQYLSRPSSLIQKGIQGGAQLTILNVPEGADYVQLNKYGFKTLLDPWDNQPANVIRAVDLYILITNTVDLLVSIPDPSRNLKDVVGHPDFLKAVTDLGVGIASIGQTTDVLTGMYASLNGAGKEDNKFVEMLFGNIWSLAESTVEIIVKKTYSNPNLIKSSIVKAAVQFSQPAGWTAVVLRAGWKVADSFGPLVGYYAFADSSHGYYLNRDAEGGLINVTRDDTIPDGSLVRKPDVAYSFTYLSPLTYRLDASATSDNSSNDQLSYQWSFGDGTSGTGKVVEHVFTAKGPRTVKLVVTDPDDNQGELSMSIDVKDGDTPHISNFIARQSAANPYLISLSADITDGDGDIKELRWYRDGAPSGKQPDTTTPPTLTHVDFLYTNDAVYNPVLEVVDQAGHVSRAATKAVVGDAPLITAVSPRSGNYAGGYRVTLTGNHLDRITGDISLWPVGKTILEVKRVTYLVSSDGKQLTFTMPSFPGRETLDIQYSTMKMISDGRYVSKRQVLENAFVLHDRQTSFTKGSALLVPDKTNLGAVDAEFKKMMEVGGPVEVVDAGDVTSGSVDLSDYGTISCFTYGGTAEVAAIDQSVVDSVMQAVFDGATFVTNEEACGAKILGTAGYYKAQNVSGYYPALRDGTFFSRVTATDPLFKGIPVFPGNPQDYSVNYWNSSDHDFLIFRIDNTKSYTGRYNIVGSPLIQPDNYLASGFGTGWSVSSINNEWWPEWKRGAGRVVRATGLRWTFNQSTESGGYIGNAGRQVLENIGAGLN